MELTDKWVPDELTAQIRAREARASICEPQCWYWLKSLERKYYSAALRFQILQIDTLKLRLLVN